MTPDELRNATLAANRGFASQKEAQEEAMIQQAVDIAIREFPTRAKQAASEGKNSIDVFECQGDYKSPKDLSEFDKKVIARLKTHFESLGFKTEMYGPYSEAWVGGGCWDLLVKW